jgi:hypothetical protein
MLSIAIFQADSNLPQEALRIPHITAVHLSSKNNNPSEEESIPLNTRITPIQELWFEAEGLLTTVFVVRR